MQQLKNFVGGEYVAAQSGKTLDNYEPATGKIYSQLPDSDQADVDQAVAAAKAAFGIWSITPSAERSAILMRIADLIEAKKDFLAQAESRDQGKPVAIALKMDILRAALNFRFFASAILHTKEYSCHTDPNTLNYGVREPIGVAGLISPWNFPLHLLTWKIAPALAMGNTVVCKPSEWTPMTAFLLGEILNQAGLPKGVCNIVLGTGERAGEALTQHSDVPLISFTGGTKTGSRIAAVTAPLFKKLSLELGGKNPNVIFADADLNRALEEGVRASFLNQGQICLCGSRIFVESSIYSSFLEAFCERTRSLVVGNPKDPNTFMGPLVSRTHLERVMSSIRSAERDGGQIHVGGKTFGEGYFLEPTVITGLSPKTQVMQEEVFGPVVTITPFDDETEVVELANSVRYGLSASVWTENLSRAHRVAHAIKAGTVWVNSWLVRDLRVPFGGMKASGVGREGGEYSLDFFSETKNICLRF